MNEETLARIKRQVAREYVYELLVMAILLEPYIHKLIAKGTLIRCG